MTYKPKDPTLTNSLEVMDIVLKAIDSRSLLDEDRYHQVAVKIFVNNVYRSRLIPLGKVHLNRSDMINLL